MQYLFTEDQDWFSNNIPTFRKHLAPFRGRPCRALEIGSHEGRSALWLLDNILTHPEARLTAIDVKAHPNFLENIRRCPGGRKLAFHHGASREVLRRLPFDTFDFAYIDGWHGTVEVLEDAVLTWPLVKRGGLVAFDDYLWDDPVWNRYGRPGPAIDAFLNIYGQRLQKLEQGWQVWIRKIADEE